MGDFSWLGPLVTSLGVVTALFIAVFGERVKRHLNPPDLNLSIENSKGVFVPRDETNPDVRWYHLHITNNRRTSPANDIRVYLRKLEESRQGNFVTLWEEPMPLTLRHEASFRQRGIVGRPRDSDFINIAFHEEKIGPKPVLAFPVIRPPRNIQVEFEQATHLRATVFVDSVEKESKDFVFDIHWNGLWNEGNDEMAKNLQVKIVP